MGCGPLRKAGGVQGETAGRGGGRGWPGGMSRYRVKGLSLTKVLKRLDLIRGFTRYFFALSPLRHPSDLNTRPLQPPALPRRPSQRHGDRIFLVCFPSTNSVTRAAVIGGSSCLVSLQVAGRPRPDPKWRKGGVPGGYRGRYR